MEFKKTGKWSEMGEQEKMIRFNRYWYGKSDYDKYITYIPNEHVNEVESFDKTTHVDSHGKSFTIYKVNFTNGQSVQSDSVEEFRNSVKKYFEGKQ